MRALEHVTGAGLIVEVSDLVSQMSDLLQGFEERAKRVQASLRSTDFGYVVVTTPSQLSLQSARDLSESMDSRGLKLDAIVFNRVAQEGLFDARPEDMVGSPRDELVGLSPAAGRVIVERAQAQATLHRCDVDGCQRFLSALDSSILAALLPAFADDVHQPERLMRVGDLLAGKSSYFAPLARK
jgi:anion-transporting  ArsA/GET3 family ATPase